MCILIYTYTSIYVYIYIYMWRRLLLVVEFQCRTQIKCRRDQQQKKALVGPGALVGLGLVGWALMGPLACKGRALEGWALMDELFIQCI